jgi:hypothetical protein
MLPYASMTMTKKIIIVPLDGHFNIFAGKVLNGVLFCTSIADDKCTCGSTRVCTHMQAARLLSKLSQRNTTENAENGLTEKEIELMGMKTRLFSPAHRKQRGGRNGTGRGRNKGAN